jgi:Cdc6-like AAA superfamily ATPase
LGIYDSAYKEAGDALYDACEALRAAVRIAGGDNTTIGDGYLTAMRRLAVYVASADAKFSIEESVAIGQIFWLNADGEDVWASRNLITAQPQVVQEALEFLTACMRQLTEPTNKQILLAAEAVFQTVLASDGSAEPEVSRLTAITTRLRQALSNGEPPPTSATSGAVATCAGPIGRDEPTSSAERISATMASLDRLVGLDSVKQQVATLINLAKVFAIRKRMGLPVPPMSFHLVFVGNPGTGKTTVARIVAELYGELGLLSKGHLVEVDRSGLVANYIGQTATKVMAVIEQALGGVLFIDEAYALDAGDATDFGQEAVSTLIKAMEDHRSDLVVIAAGYTEPMQQFLQMNPGLRSRMSRDLVFADYSPDEMVEIFRGMAAQAGYALAPDCGAVLTQIFQRLWQRRGKDFANARDVRNVFERAIEAQANRLCGPGDPSADAIGFISDDDLLVAAGA